jgi:mannosyltransferase OCH1-like enzyme
MQGTIITEAGDGKTKQQLMIPKILHQTWKDNNVPEHLLSFVSSWKSNHPAWNYILWTDEMNRNFIADQYPEFLPQYDAYPANIQRVDAVRYFILQKMGGVFIDLDFECLKSIDPLVENQSFVAGLEPSEHAATHQKEFIVSNAFMACSAGHSFLSDVCAALTNLSHGNMPLPTGFNAILESTGPFMLTRVYQQYVAKELVSILPHELLFPLSKNNKTGKIDREDEKNINKLNEAYAIHHHWGSWWQVE